MNVMNTTPPLPPPANSSWEDGVSWSNRFGGICPACQHTNTPVASSPGWDGPVKIRWHKCECGQRFKSVDYDPTEPPDW